MFRFKTNYLLLFLCLHGFTASAQEKQVLERLQGLDAYMEKILKDWNAPGIGVGIVVKDKLVFAKGYGYRDYGKKLPITANTLFPIASNTKLFTATAMGFLVEEGKMEWDKPVKEIVPAFKFYNKELDNTVTMRDMLSHRTGISRHDAIWNNSEMSNKEMFEKLQYLEPSAPLRQTFLYNNLMYVAAGYALEVQTGKTWEGYVQEKILTPLGMTNTIFSEEEMKKQPDYVVLYNEKLDTNLFYEVPHYITGKGLGPAGSINSSINDMSKWVIAQINGGKYKGNQVIPRTIINATLVPNTAYGNQTRLDKGWIEKLNGEYGMGRNMSVYQGHLLTAHGGDLPGIHSQVSCMPTDSIGVIVFTIGDHTRPLRDVVTYHVYDRILGLKEVPWSERELGDSKKLKQTAKESKAKIGFDKVLNTKPSHALADYVGEFEHPAYGTISIRRKDNQIHAEFHKIPLPLTHYHYDRFDTQYDDLLGNYALNFLTNAQGDIDKIIFPLDETEAVFVRKADASMLDAKNLAKYEGVYILVGIPVKVVLKENKLIFIAEGSPDLELTPYKKDKFKVKQFDNVMVQFVYEQEKIIGFDIIDSSGIQHYTKK